MDAERLTLPDLPSPYDAALRSAVRWIDDAFEVVGIIACGSIIRGNPGASSDFDIVAVHRKPLRQRIQRWFKGIPAEIFVNSPAAIRHYFVEENRDARPCTAHMISFGVILVDRDPVVNELIAEALAWLRRPPTVSEAQLARTRYCAVDLLDNAADLLNADSCLYDPAGAELLLHRSVAEILGYLFQKRSLNIPRDKELFNAVEALEPDIGRRARAVYAAGNIQDRFVEARRLAHRVLGVSRFFEWETEPEHFPPFEDSDAEQWRRFRHHRH